MYEEDKKSTLERLGWQGTFKFRALWCVRDGKGLNRCACSTTNVLEINQRYFSLNNSVEKFSVQST